jgi:HPt (histidine-containing phosphotransfer) domain-containing protein
MELSRRGQALNQQSRTDKLDPAIFDREHLSQYTNGDAALERELVTLFLVQFAPFRSQLDAALSEYDWKFAAHSLKGSARSIGAPAIAALTEKLEAMGFDAPGRSKKRALDQLDAAMSAFADEVKKAVN